MSVTFNEIIDVVGLISLVGGGVVLYYTIKNSLPAYFSEKGKNLATQEDVSKITKLVEETKYQFTAQVELLKANLQINSNLQLNLKAEERKAIFDYNEKISVWLHLHLDVSSIKKEDNEVIDTYSETIRKAYRDLSASDARLRLLLGDNEITNASSQFKMVILEKLGALYPEFAHNLKRINSEYSIKKAQTVSVPISSMYQEIRVLSEKYSEDMLNGYREIDRMERSFQETCRIYLRRLMDEQ